MLSLKGYEGENQEPQNPLVGNRLIQGRELPSQIPLSKEPLLILRKLAGTPQMHRQQDPERNRIEDCWITLYMDQKASRDASSPS